MTQTGLGAKGFPRGLEVIWGVKERMGLQGCVWVLVRGGPMCFQ